MVSSGVVCTCVSLREELYPKWVIGLSMRKSNSVFSTGFAVCGPSTAPGLHAGTRVRPRRNHAGGKIRRARTDGTPTDVICRYIPEGMDRHNQQKKAS